MNTLHLGDCLSVLRNKLEIPDNSVDLVYIDPPFNSNRDYAIFFDDEEIQTQHVAFEDTWSLKNITDSLTLLNTLQTEKLYHIVECYREVAPKAYPYLVMMALRINELHKVLKPTGSFYLHCDPTMSHYLKTICDIVFGEDMFINEIIWRRAGSHNARRSYGPIHDTILVYGKTKKYKFKINRRPYMKGHVEQRYKRQPDGQMKFISGGNVLTGDGITNGPSGQEWRGFNPTKSNRHWAIPGFYEEMMPESYPSLNTLEKLEALYQAKLIEINKTAKWPIMVRYLGERDGVPYQDIWAYQPYTEGTLWGTEEGIDKDVQWISPTAQERLKYPTQKPLGLLERIIKVSTDEGDTVLDAFCGCGTTVDAAEHLGRNWIGIDISSVAVAQIKDRIKKRYKGTLSKFEVRGMPSDHTTAKSLADENPFAFQDWWVMDLGALSPTYGGKGADKGLDGLAKYLVGKKGESIKVGFQVKTGGRQSKDMQAFIGALRNAKCELGVFLSVNKATPAMMDVIANEGIVEIGGYNYPKLQVITLEEYMEKGKRPNLPKENVTFTSARYGKKEGTQEAMDL